MRTAPPRLREGSPSLHFTEEERLTEFSYDVICLQARANGAERVTCVTRGTGKLEMQSSLLRFLQRREQEGPPGKVRHVQREEPC